MNFRRDPKKTLVGVQASTIGSGELPSRYGVQFDANGKIFIRFLDEEGERELPLGTLMSRPDFALTIARYIFATSLAIEHETRKSKRKLAGYYFNYLNNLENVFKISTDDADDVDQANLDGYQQWLDGDKRYRSKLKLSNVTKKARYNFVIEAMNWARGTDTFRDRIPDLISRTHKWSGAHHGIKGTKSLSAVETAETILACRSEIDPILERLRQGEVAREIQRLPPLEHGSTVPFNTPGIIIASFAKLVETVNPPWDVLRSRYRGLGRRLNKEDWSVAGVVPHLFFTWDTIIPFIVLIALETGFNPSVQCGMKQSDASDHPVWPNTLRLAPPKKRAIGRLQVRTFSKDEKNPFAVPSLLSSLQRYSDWYRPLAKPRDNRNVFLVWDKLGSAPCGLLNNSGDVSARLYLALDKFVERHSLSGFTLSVLRQTVADFAQMIADGDTIDVQTMMGHASDRTSQRSYDSEGQKRRRDARLAKATRERQRFIDSSGKVRLDDLGSGIPKRAATPGFLCWDLYDSPVLGQKKGRMCAAYGCCPDCPLACIHVDDPKLPENFVRLKELYERTRDSTDHIRWAVYWHPRFEAFSEIWLPTVDHSALAAASAHPWSPLPGLE